jgi:hypothetical protein
MGLIRVARRAGNQVANRAVAILGLLHINGVIE